MVKIKERFKNIFNNVKKVFEKFPATMIVIAFATLFSAFFLDTDVISGEILGKIVVFCVFYAVGLFFTESFFKEKFEVKAILYIAFAIISAWFTYISIESNKVNGFFWGKVIICYCIIFPILAIWKLYKRSGTNVGEYLSKVFSNFVKNSFVYGILAGGIAAVTAIFIYLILEDSIDYDLILRMEIILLGLFYIPNCIDCFVNLEEDVSKFFRVVIKYVFGGLLVAAFVIIYMYMIKIIVLRKIPSNQIFRILASLFICGLPIWTMNSLWEKEENTWQKIINKLPLAFIPFILLQIYSIWSRISANGLTEARYLCVMLVIFEIIYSIIYIKKREKIADILLVFNVLTVIAITIPFVNMFDMSNLSQYNRLKIYKEKEILTEEEQSQVLGAYRFLNNSTGGEKYIDKILNEEDMKKISEFKSSSNNDNYYNYNYNYNDYEYVYASLDSIDEINIEGYKSLEIFSKAKANGDYEEKFSSEEGKNIEIKDLDEILKKYVESYEKDRENFRENDFRNNNEFIIDENTKIILNYVDINYDKLNKEINSYRIEGYLLTK